MHRILVCLTLLTVYACAKTPCERLIDDDKSINEKACTGTDGGQSSGQSLLEFGGTITTTSQCTTALKSCSSKDQTQLDSYLTCLEAVPACNENNGTTVVADPGNCVAEDLSSMSDECITAFGGSYGSGADGG